MKEAELQDLIASWENLELIVNEASANEECLTMLIDMALNSDHPRSWRAAWVADKIYDSKPELIGPYITRMVMQLSRENSSSKKRHFLKLISLHEISSEYHSFLLEYCIRCFTSAAEPVAVRVYAMQILYNISEKEPELKPELHALILHETEIHSSPGLKARGKKLVDKLRREMSKSGIRST